MSMDRGGKFLNAGITIARMKLTAGSKDGGVAKSPLQQGPRRFAWEASYEFVL
jgi:hypothetical protein